MFKKHILAAFFVLLSVLGIYFLLQVRSFHPEHKTAEIADDVEKYIEKSEKAFKNLKKDSEKKIIWTSADKKKTKYVLVYLPSFAAGRKEIYPVIETLANDLRANVFFTRWAGHGGLAEDYKNLSAQDLFDTAQEALTVGKKLGDEVIIVGTGLGASMASTMAILDSKLTATLKGTEPESHLKAVVLISPIYSMLPDKLKYLASPFGPLLAPFYANEFIERRPKNPDIFKYWDTKYHRDGLIQLAKTVEAINRMDLHDLKLPTLVLYTKLDKEGLPSLIEAKFNQIGGYESTDDLKNGNSNMNSSQILTKKKLISILTPDPILAGEFTSPQTTQTVISEIKDWLDSVGISMEKITK